jgi:hypothetical protein
MDLTNIKLGYSALGTENIYLYRHGKNSQLALDKRKAEFDVMQVITTSMMDNSPKGSSKEYTLDGKTWFELTVKPINKPTK